LAARLRRTASCQVEWPQPILPETIIPAMQGVDPSTVVSCPLDGEPNATIISQI
jgi:hypothetical protein